MKNFKFLLYFSLISLALVSFSSCEKDPVDPVDETRETITGAISSDVTWTADKSYILSGKVVVDNGATLTIEPGTIVKGDEGTASLASALIITRGSKIMAEGTAANPIIFTSVLDNIQIGEKTGTNLDENDRSKWGGLIILGNAQVSVGEGDTEGGMEGIPVNEDYGKYGGTDNTDNSGVLKYVSIRHGGAEIGEGNEINGLTLGGVGSGTVIENVEVVSNLDDGIEFFGGAVNVTNALVAYQGDDAFDIDQNYRGTISNLMSIQDANADNALEIDGPEGETYIAGLFTLENGTFISESDAVGRAATLKSRAQGNIVNSVFKGFASGIRVRADYVDAVDCVSKIDAASNMVDGTLVLTGNTAETSLAPFLFIFPDGEDLANCVSAALTDDIQTKWTSNNTEVTSNAVSTTNTSVFEGWSWSALNGKL